MSREQGNRRWIRCICMAAAVAVLSLSVLSGCVFSNTITEKVYKNDKDNQVDATVEPVLVNTANAKETSDDLPSLEYNPDSKSKDQTKTTLPVYSDDKSKATSDLPAPRPRYNKNAGKLGEVSVQKTEKPKTETKEDTEENPEVESTTQKTKKTKKTKKTTKGKTNKSDKSGKGSKNATKKKSKAKRSSGGTGSVYDNDPDSEEPVIPENIDEVAAVGNNAVIVSMIAGSKGSSSLVACDQDTKKKTARVLKAKGIDKVQALWSGDGSSSGSLSDSNFKKLVNKVVPDLVFVTEGENTLSKSQIKQLAKKNIDVYTLPRLTSAKRIKFTVSTVGEILDAGGVKNAKKNADAYLDFHEKIIDTYTDANGGLTSDFNFDSEEEIDPPSTVPATLYIDAWDSKARFNDSHGFLSTSNGIALATLGYADSPISYYLSAGGVLNNAASKIMRKQDTTEYGIVWQFARNELNYSFDKWSGLDEAGYDLCDHISGGVFRSNLLWYTGITATGYGLGTANFPGVIVKNKKLASLMQSSSEKSGDPYYPYPTISPAGHGKTIGYFTSEDERDYVEACIGSDGTGAIAMVDEMFAIYTNPKGLCQKDSSDPLCSWSDGSVESVLEASWAHYRFRNGSKDAFEKDVKDFYSKFYGYSLSSDDLDAIEDGPVK